MVNWHSPAITNKRVGGKINKVIWFDFFYTRPNAVFVTEVHFNQFKVWIFNMDAKRDWSHAEDFVRAVWLMLNEDKPKDYLLASGETHTVREFVELAFENAGIKGSWSGSGVDEKFNLLGEFTSGISLVKVNPDFYRPAEVDLLWGDPSEAQKDLNWEKSVDFPGLVRRMVVNDLKEINSP